MSPESRVTISPSVYARSFGEELVLLDFNRGEYFALDAIGARVWRSLEQGRTIAEAADAIVVTHEVSRDRALADVTDLVTHLANESLVAVC